MGERRGSGARAGGLRRVLCAVAWLALASPALAAAAGADGRPGALAIYSAGSLRDVVVAAIREGAAGPGVDVRPTFGGAGNLRERIERGDRPDVFLSADMASPRTLAQSGRALLPAIPFARNRMCLVARSALGVTAANLVDRMLARDVRLKASAPISDPSGDYAAAIFDRIDAQRPGAGRALREKVRSTANLRIVPADHRNPLAALFLDGRIDMTVTYCSGARALAKDVPDLSTLPFPPALDPGPVYGLAVLSNNPAASRLALFLVSEQGQRIVEDAGLLPVTNSP